MNGNASKTMPEEYMVEKAGRCWWGREKEEQNVKEKSSEICRQSPSAVCSFLFSTPQTPPPQCRPARARAGKCRATTLPFQRHAVRARVQCAMCASPARAL